MRKSNFAAALPFLSIALVAAAVALTLFGSDVARATNAAMPGLLPQSWVGPVNVTNSPYYDNTSSIAASPLNDAITVVWERRMETENENQILQVSTQSLGGAMNGQRLQRSGWKLNGSAKVAHDSQGRRHAIWYHNGDGSHAGVCGYYATIEADGRYSVIEEIPGTCGGNRKNTAIAIGPDGSVHALFGWNQVNVYYYHRNTNGQWDVQNELITESGAPEGLTLTVSTQGVVMAGWKGWADGNSDFFTGIRSASGQWAIENISYYCCTGCPEASRTYTPSLAAAPDGGIRAAWGDERCPRTDPRGIDVYYREWRPGTGWNNQPIVQVFRGTGEAYDVTVAVDSAGTAHIVWSDDSGRLTKQYNFFYASGRGTVFTAASRPFTQWAGSAFLKEPSVDVGSMYLHASFSSDRDDNQKENYYVRLPLDVVPPPTPTPRCPGQRFSDVCPDDYFYTNVLNLVNLGVLSGYEDGTFRPHNNLTRGQASKMIALAANLPANLQGAPHFADVPSNHAFYNFIEYAFNAGVISGYDCGGQAEPCDAQRRPYFRASNNVTRGQLAKMASEAFRFTEPVSGQTFTDVAPGSAFYTWVERMARRGIIGGYNDAANCAGVGTPCFKPGLNVTRAQASKIVDGGRVQAGGAPTP